MRYHLPMTKSTPWSKLKDIWFLLKTNSKRHLIIVDCRDFHLEVSVKLNPEGAKRPCDTLIKSVEEIHNEPNTLTKNGIV